MNFVTKSFHNIIKNRWGEYLKKKLSVTLESGLINIVRIFTALSLLTTNALAGSSSQSNVDALAQDKMVSSCYESKKVPESFKSLKDFNAATLYYFNAGLFDKICELYLTVPVDALITRDASTTGYAEEFKAKPLTTEIAERVAAFDNSKKWKNDVPNIRPGIIAKHGSKKVEEYLSSAFSPEEIEYMYGPVMGYGSGTILDGDVYIEAIKRSKIISITTAFQVNEIGACISAKQSVEKKNKEPWGLPDIYTRNPLIYPTMELALKEQRGYILTLRNYLNDIVRTVSNNEEEKEKLREMIDSVAFNSYIGLDAPSSTACDRRSGEYLEWYRRDDRNIEVVKMSGHDLAQKARTCKDGSKFAKVLVDTAGKQKEAVDFMGAVKNSLKFQGSDYEAKTIESFTVKTDANQSGITVEEASAQGMVGLEEFLVERFQHWLNGRYGSGFDKKLTDIDFSAETDSRKIEGLKLYLKDWQLPREICLNNTIFQTKNSKFCKSESVKIENSVSPRFFISKALSELQKSVDLYSTLLLQNAEEDLKTTAFRNKVSYDYACDQASRLTDLEGLVLKRSFLEDRMPNETNKVSLRIESALKTLELIGSASNAKDFEAISEFALRIKNSTSVEDYKRIKDIGRKTNQK